jgi:threonine dehydratase
MINLKDVVLEAQKRIESYLPATPVIHSFPLSKLFSSNIYLKLENMQPTNAFKVRGALNKLLSLSPEDRKKGVVAASTGNHGAAVAYGSHLLNVKNTIFVPENASPLKIDNIKNYDAELCFHGTDVGQTEHFARNYAEEHDRIYISPYNDIAVVAGQGTIGAELSQQLEHIDAVLVPVGGGGLISGIAGYLKSVRPEIRMIGCLPENSPVMSECVKAGKIIHVPTTHTISDATKGNLEKDSITFDFCRQFVDEFILVSEADIINAIQIFMKKQHVLVEGAVGVALASLIKNNEFFNNKKVVIILSGSNISFDALKTIVC